MNPETFFDNFGMLADVPDGVSKLRKLILQLAVQGKLVAQDENDEPASVLLEKIKAEKERLVKEKKIKRTKASASIDEEGIFLKIPSTWNYVRLNDVFDVRDGTHDSPKYVPTGIPLITSKNLSSGRLDFTNVKYISEEDHSKISERSNVNKYDILFAMIGSIGNPIIVNTVSEFSIKNVALFKYYSFNLSVPKYVYYFLMQASNHMRKQAAGGVQSFVSLGYLRNYVFHLPPLAEQHRIVTKVDTLMALCDELESRQQKKQEARLRLNSAALDKLLTAHEPVEFAHHWQRVCDNFDLLYDNPETVGELRKSILQLAVQGRLVRQDENDELAAVLLGKIKAEKEKLVKEYKIKKTNVFPDLEVSDVLFELPNGWLWSRIGEIFITSSGTTPNRSNHQYHLNGTENWVKTTDLNNGIVLSCEEKITLQAVKDCNLRYYPIGTVCIAMYGGGGTIGKSGILGIETTINQSVYGIYPNKYINTNFVHLYIKSIRLEWMKFAAGLRKAPNINGKIIDRMVFPLPPLEEQRRIVARVDQLMTFCDELESKLKQSQTDGAKLMEAVVHKLVAA